LALQKQLCKSVLVAVWLHFKKFTHLLAQGVLPRAIERDVQVVTHQKLFIPHILLPVALDKFVDGLFLAVYAHHQ
jgi:hypothetical protein